MSHLFISYSHTDDEYVSRLAQALEEAGFAAWVDDRIDYGTTWTGEVQRRLDTCDAFILVMTSRSFESRWVNNELSRAMRKNKPIFPLLLEGEEPWLAVESIQFLDVRGGKMPDERFLAQLATVADRRKPTEAFPERVIEATQEPIPAKTTEPRLEPPGAIEAVEEKLIEELPSEPKAQPEADLPGKVEEKRTVLTEVVKEKKKRVKPVRIRRVREGQPVGLRKWVAAGGIALGLVVLAGATWLLRGPLGFVPAPQGTEMSTAASTLAAGEIPLPTTTAGPVAYAPITIENAGSVVELGRLNDQGVISQMVVHPTGDLLAVGTSLGTAILDPDTFEEKDFLESEYGVSSLAFSEDGQRLALGLRNNTIQVMNMDSETLYTLETSSIALSLAFDPAGEYLGAALFDGNVPIWSAADGSLVTTLDGEGKLRSVVFSSLNPKLAYAGNAGLVYLWGIAPDFNLIDTLEANAYVLSLAFSETSDLLAGGAVDGTIRVWSTTNGTRLHYFEQGGLIPSLAFNPVNDLMASGSENGVIYMWRPGGTNIDPVGILEGGHTTWVRSLVFDYSGQLLYSAGSDGNIARWKIGGLYSLEKVETKFSQYVSSVAVSPDGETLAISREDGSVMLQKIAGQEEPIVLEGPLNSIQIGYSRDGTSITTVPLLQAIGTWRLSDRQFTLAEYGASADVNTAIFNPARDEVAIGYTDGVIRVYNHQAELQREWSSAEEGSPVSWLKYNREGDLLAASYEDGTLILWQEVEPVMAHRLENFGTLTALSFHPDGRSLLLAGVDGSLRSLDLDDKEVHDLDIPGFSGEIASAMAFNPDGTLLALGSSKGIALVDKDKLLTWLVGHSLPATSLVWLDDGSMLISASDDGSVRWWGLEP